MNRLLLAATLTLAALAASAQTPPPATPTPAEAVKVLGTAAKGWFEKISLRGYTQIRHNGAIENNERLACEQCDKSLGDQRGFFVRRARLVFSGDAHEKVYIYVQPDLASAAGTGNNHFAQLRDLYFDLAFDDAKEFRVRAGQSKVPYGFENLQSSQNRLPLDRNDALNSGVANERDLGAFFYWAPAATRKRFSHLVNSGLKGSGDYGVFALGLYNGQTANKSEANRSLHAVSRLSFPFELPGGQIVEPGVQGYWGRVVVPVSQRTAGVGGGPEFRDDRFAASLIVYPQPFGFASEWNWGQGPEFHAPTRTIQRRRITGGYAQLMWMAKAKGMTITPYARGQYYDGGKKHETDARSYLVRELEAGVEWQFNKTVELVTAYSYADRAYEDLATRGNRQKGGRTRFQLQVNY